MGLKAITLDRLQVSMLRAERLCSPDFDKTLRDVKFLRNVVLCVVDEAHVLLPWGKDLRKDYHGVDRLRCPYRPGRNSCF